MTQDPRKLTTVAGNPEAAEEAVEARLVRLGQLLQTAYALACTVEHSDDLTWHLSEAYDDLDFLKAVHRARSQ